MANDQTPQTYARAIFEQAAADWLTPLKKAATCFTGVEIDQLDNTGIPFSEKQQIIQRVVPNASNEVKNFLSLLASRNEMHLLPEIISEFDQYTQRGPSRHVARVKTAIVLTDDEKRALEGKMRGRFGADTEFEYVVDSSILGGVIVRLGDQLIDGSVASKLNALREKLAHG
ncbi:MAG: ATP synthase F1 subunit delta [Chloroflexi bacterium]|nr:ATP synthase F1 subunit delta [Chloroflexota bacterium]